MKFPYMAVILVMRLAQEEAVAKYNGRSNRQLWPTKDSKNPTKKNPPHSPQKSKLSTTNSEKFQWNPDDDGFPERIMGCRDVGIRKQIPKLGACKQRSQPASQPSIIYPSTQ
jgi:hypothetical protein